MRILVHYKGRVPYEKEYFIDEGSRILTKEGLNFKNNLDFLGGSKTNEKPLKLDIFWKTTKDRGEIHRILKPILDCLESICWLNYSQVASLNIKKEVSNKESLAIIIAENGDSLCQS